MSNTTAFLVFRSMRPRQWTKNLILFAALIFSQNIFSPLLLFRAVAAFAIFCFLSGCVYIINDLLDLKQDQIHPIKSKRPLASGKLKPATAVIGSSPSSILYCSWPIQRCSSMWLSLMSSA
ncbi:MAG: UbiA family prenyltransferase [Proteobacteria bacterium]|nr:UbiA family prenyltransferase [Pseudomonadota bacterium]